MKVDIGTPSPMSEHEKANIETAGLVSGYQKTNITTGGVSAVLETGNLMRFGVIAMPWHFPLPLTKPSVGIKPGVVARDEDELAKGYRAMAAENSLLAEESLPAALEVWPAWEE